MARLDVHRMRIPTHYVIDCQADILSSLNTRFVVPLLPISDAPSPAARLNPVFTINGIIFVMVTQFAASVPVTELGEAVANLGDHQYTISNALDMLISGF